MEKLVKRIRRGGKLSEFESRSITHGKSNSKTYRSWINMLSRCLNPKHIAYPYYGGRGILISDEWRFFPNFLRDMGERPSGMTLDRIDSNGNYTKGNCRWANKTQQQRNRRDNFRLTYGGKTLTIFEWSERLNMRPVTIRNRLKRGWSVCRALEQKPKQYQRKTK